MALFQEKKYLESLLVEARSRALANLKVFHADPAYTDVRTMIENTLDRAIVAVGKLEPFPERPADPTRVAAAEKAKERAALAAEAKHFYVVSFGTGSHGGGNARMVNREVSFLVHANSANHALMRAEEAARTHGIRPVNAAVSRATDEEVEEAKTFLAVV